MGIDGILVNLHDGMLSGTFLRLNSELGVF